LEVDTLLANWVELDQVPDGSVDHCLSLFSTLGMIHGRANRRAALRHTCRIMRPGGLFVMHVHNFWFNLYDAGGPWWALQSLLCSPFRRRSERGDKYFPYRGVPNMFLHVFTAGEVRGDLRHAGFRLRAMTPIAAATQHALKWPRLLPSLRGCGWLIVAQKK
jgi:SAM-dependent methyltransferase